jgi:hypothetical protein
MKKMLVVLTFFCMIIGNFYVLGMQSLRKVWPKTIVSRSSGQGLMHMQQQPGSPSFFSRMQQSISQWIAQIRNKYFVSRAESAYTPTHWGQSEITSMPIAAMSQELGQKDLNTILEIIQQNRKVQNLENDMNGLLRCGYPGPEFLVISEIKSISDFENFFEDMRKRIFLSSGFDNTITEKLLSTIKEKRVHAIKKNYTQARANIIHEDIPQLATIKKLCMQVGINPQSTSIKLIPRLEALRNIGTLASVNTTFDKNGIVTDCVLSLSPFISTGEIRLPGIRIKVELPSLQNFVITHEIGHIIRNHCEEMELISQEFYKLFPYGSQYAQESLPSIRQLSEQLEALYELEADIIVAMQSPQIAEAIGFEIAQVYGQSNQDVRTRLGSPIHSSLGYKQDLLTRILDLHYSNDKENKLKQLKE